MRQQREHPEPVIDDDGVAGEVQILGQHDASGVGREYRRARGGAKVGALSHRRERALGKSAPIVAHENVRKRLASGNAGAAKPRLPLRPVRCPSSPSTSP